MSAQRTEPMSFVGPHLLFGSLAVATITSLDGCSTFALPALLFIVAPLVELYEKRHPAMPESAGSSVGYRAVLYAAAAIQFVLVSLFLGFAADKSTAGTVGVVMTMGVMCGSFGINVSHELMHGRRHFDRTLAACLACVCCLGQFVVEHWFHHVDVATPLDPVTAPRGRSLWRHVISSSSGSLLKAWLRRPVQMIQLTLLQAAIWASFWFISGWRAVLLLFAASIVGVFLLECFNYVQHYGLERRWLGQRYERPGPQHSWVSLCSNSRRFLFNLPLHADHHLHGGRPYQDLRSIDGERHLPTGYMGCVLLAMLPPLWRRIMDHRIDEGVL